ncbi:unnamed protein product [Lasius platythorax]|uniref:Uncharacterized protein n=1 Tax=Lasius platythorax TaxID=488582 RepID=A0AAV2MZS4_9HYME
MHPYALKLNREEGKEVKKKLRSFEEGDAVYFRNYNALGPKWLEGTIEVCVNPVSYKIRLSNGNVIKRHIDKLRRRVVNSTVYDGEQEVNEPSAAVETSSARWKDPAQVPLPEQSIPSKNIASSWDEVPELAQDEKTYEDIGGQLSRRHKVRMENHKARSRSERKHRLKQWDHRLGQFETEKPRNILKIILLTKKEGMLCM